MSTNPSSKMNRARYVRTAIVLAVALPFIYLGLRDTKPVLLGTAAIMLMVEAYMWMNKPRPNF